MNRQHILKCLQKRVQREKAIGREKCHVPSERTKLWVQCFNMKYDDTLHKRQTLKKQEYFPSGHTALLQPLFSLCSQLKCIRTYQLRQQEHPYKASARKRAFQLPLK